MIADFVAALLALIYFVLFCAEARQLVDIFYGRNRIINYRNAIIALMAAAALLRIIFWSKTALPTQASVTFFMVCFYLPIWLNFAALSLLSLFYANAIYKHAYGRWPFRICIFLNIVFLTLNLTIACLLEEVSTHHGVVYSLYVTYAIFLDGLTALLVGYFGHRFVAMHYGQEEQFLLPRSVQEFSAVNWVLVLCFLARSVLVGVLSSGRLVRQSTVKVEFNGTHKHTSFTLLLFFILTEVVPSVCMLYLLWRSSASRALLKSVSLVDSSPLEEYYSMSLKLNEDSEEDEVVKVFYDHIISSPSPFHPGSASLDDSISSLTSDDYYDEPLLGGRSAGLPVHVGELQDGWAH